MLQTRHPRYNREMRKPLFSVIIPTLNEEKFLPLLLDSLMVQTNKSFEVIVVDGKSKDRTVEVAKLYAKKLPALSVVMSPKASLPYQRNFGTKHAHGEWFVFVDADGIFLPYFIERCESFIVSHTPTVFTSWFMPDSRVSADALFTLVTNITLEMSLVVKRQLTPGPLTLVSRRAFDVVGGYDEEHVFNEDVDFGLRLAKAGFILSILRETLCVYSLRRFRKQGKLKVIQQYVTAGIVALFTNSALKKMPGYIMGGHLYGKRKRVKQSLLKTYEKKLRQLSKEIFS